jgi:hypothetical protein
MMINGKLFVPDQQKKEKKKQNTTEGGKRLRQWPFWENILVDRGAVWGADQR